MRAVGAEMDDLAAVFVKPTGTVMGRAVINEKLTAIEVLVMRQDEALVEHVVGVVAEVLLDPLEFVVPCRRVVPRRSREHVQVEQGSQVVNGLNRARHRIHEGENSGDVVLVGVLLEQVGSDLGERALKVHEGVVHIYIESWFLARVLAYVFAHPAPHGLTRSQRCAGTSRYR